MTIQGSKKVLVAGIAGRVGWMIVPELLSEGHDVKIITETPEKINEFLMPHVEVVEGSLANAEDLRKALDGVEGACLMMMPHEKDAALEALHGRTVIDACREKGVRHFVYVSICCADRNTRVPHLEAMGMVEEHLKRSGLSYTILRPAWYMENFLSKRYLSSIEKGVLAMPLRPDRTLDLVSAADVGRIVAEAFTVPDKFREREIDLAGDRLTMEEIAEEISRVMPREVVYRQVSAGDDGWEMGRDMEAMFRWMDGHGFGADLELAENLLKRFEIGLMNLRTFLHDHREEFRKAA
jgi:uncharacterized protein YbjT (DUF2867 family)